MQSSEAEDGVSRVLEAIGTRGTYQGRLVVLLFCIAAEVNYFIMGPTFIFMNPLFECSFTADLVDQSIACSRLIQCQIQSPYTIVAKAELYCDGQDSRNWIQAIGPIGAILGLIVVNWLLDIKGKRVAFFVGQWVGLTGVVLLLLGGYAESVWMLMLGQIGTGFSSFSLMLLAYIIPGEFCDDQYKDKLIIVINYGWALTSVIIGVLYYTYNLWSDFLIYFVLLPMIVVTAMSHIYFREGPRFLYEQGRKEECIETLTTIATVNKTLPQLNQALELLKWNKKEDSADKVKEEKQSMTYWEVFTNKSFLFMMALLTSLQFGANLYYFGVNFAIDQLGYAYGANMIATGLLEFFGYLILNYIIDIMPKKKSLQISFGIVIILGLFFALKFVRDSDDLTFIVIGAIRLVMTMEYAVTMMLLTDAFPMGVQGICCAVVEGLSQIGCFMAPMIINICINQQVHPMLALTFIVIFTNFIPNFALPDEKKELEVKQTQLSLLTPSKGNQ